MALPWTRWGLRPQTRIYLVSKGIMPLAELEAEPQPATCLLACRGRTKGPLVSYQRQGRKAQWDENVR